ncbi:hypothetical protein Hypma_013141 [Hypsizygus marmoreus]|uniref:Protein kinase domain-containing protein n=1 Tax=Hypsizygus marmoreus TaxID=39966 RepID=A0A369JDI8_HYPMA|nr:hypothetical protein Hypma_013141 [Hypsizygus marmoreus]
MNRYACSVGLSVTCNAVPHFIIRIADPYLSISGAVSADRFISQPLTVNLYLGDGPNLSDRLYKIAKVLQILRSCLDDLEDFCLNLRPIPSQPGTSSTDTRRMQASSGATSLSFNRARGMELASFPHFRQFTSLINGSDVNLEYAARLSPKYSEKAVFKALAQTSGAEGSFQTVVVKFTSTYYRIGHELLARKSRAPRLWFCEEVESVGMYVVVMDFVERRRPDDESPLSPELISSLEETVSELHANELVFGDLSPPNVILCEGSTGGKFAPCSSTLTGVAKKGRLLTHPTSIWTQISTGINVYAVVGRYSESTINTCSGSFNGLGLTNFHSCP